RCRPRWRRLRALIACNHDYTKVIRRAYKARAGSMVLLPLLLRHPTGCGMIPFGVRGAFRAPLTRIRHNGSEREAACRKYISPIHRPPVRSPIWIWMKQRAEPSGVGLLFAT